METKYIDITDTQYIPDIQGIQRLSIEKDTISGLYLAKIPKGMIFYRGLTNIECEKYKKISDPENKFTENIYIAGPEVAYIYAIKQKLTDTINILIKKGLITGVANINEMSDEDKILVYQTILEIQDGIIIGYKTTKDLYVLDLLNGDNLKKINELYRNKIEKIRQLYDNNIEKIENLKKMNINDTSLDDILEELKLNKKKEMGTYIDNYKSFCLSTGYKLSFDKQKEKLRGYSIRRKLTDLDSFVSTENKKINIGCIRPHLIGYNFSTTDNPLGYNYGITPGRIYPQSTEMTTYRIPSNYDIKNAQIKSPGIEIFGNKHGIYQDLVQ